MGIKNWVGGWFSKSKPLRQGDTALVVAPPTGPRFDEPPKGDLEKMSGGPAVILPYFLPFFDPQQTVGETQLQRLAYRVMLADPTVKASLFAKIFGVAALELNVNPPTDKPRDQKIADFVKWNLTQRLMEGLPGLVWSVFSGGLVDGYSVCEKVWGQQTIGRWEGKDVLRIAKAQDVDNDLVLNVDPHRNIVSIQGLRYNAGLVFDTRDFVVWRHLGMYNLPTGMSDLRACYDDKTEVLTKAGWKFFADVTDEDEIASLDKSDGGEGKLVYEKPNHRTEYHYTGKMFRQKGLHVDLCVTPNHRMYVAKRNGDGSKKPFEFVTADRLMDGTFPKIVHYKRDAEWEGEEVDTFVLPEIEIKQQMANQFGTYGERCNIVPEMPLPMDDWLRFLGIYIAEGHCYQRKDGNRQCSVTITQKEGQNLEDIKRLVERLGFNYCIGNPCEGKSASNVIIPNKQLWSYLRHLGKSKAKYIPAEYKDLSSRQLSILMDWMLKGDGRHEGTNYCTSSKRLADDVSEIVLKIGFAPLIRREENENAGMWIVSLNKKGIGRTEVNRIKDKRSWEDYDGMVYCVSVPHGLVYVRRNGRSQWCGNSYMSYWMLDTVRKLRAKGATKRAFPFIWGTYPDASKQPALENALAKINSQNWFSCPEGVQLQLLDVAGSSSDYFQSFTESLQKEIALSIEGAVLQQQTGGVGQSRGATSGHKDTADLRKWWLSECFCHSVLNHEETGLIPELVGRNFAGVKEFPIASLGGVDAAELAEELKIDDGLSKLGFLQTAEDLGKRYGRKQAPPGEECQPPQAMGPDGQPMGGDGADGGGGEDWLSKSLAGAAKGDGENGNGNGQKNGNGKPKPPGGGGESFAEAPHKFSSTQFNLEDAGYPRSQGSPVADVLAMGRRISDLDLAEDGRKDEPHVTAKYGLHTKDAKAVHRLVNGFGGIEISLGKTFISPGDEYDVVNIAVESQRLHDLNALLAELPHTDKHPNYIPHVCLAYVKPGMGEKYVGWDDVEGKKLHCVNLVFSSAEGEQTAINLAKAEFFAEWTESHHKRGQPGNPGQFGSGGGGSAASGPPPHTLRKSGQAQPHILQSLSAGHPLSIADIAASTKQDPGHVADEMAELLKEGKVEHKVIGDVVQYSLKKPEATGKRAEHAKRDETRQESRQVIDDVTEMMQGGSAESTPIKDTADDLAQQQMAYGLDVAELGKAAEAHVKAIEDYAGHLRAGLKSAGADPKQLERAGKVVTGALDKMHAAKDKYLAQADAVNNQEEALAALDEAEPETETDLPEDAMYHEPEEPDEFEPEEIPEKPEEPAEPDRAQYDSDEDFAPVLSEWQADMKDYNTEVAAWEHEAGNIEHANKTGQKAYDAAKKDFDKAHGKWEKDFEKATESHHKDEEKAHDKWEKDKEKLESRIEKDKEKLTDLEQKFDAATSDGIEAIDDHVSGALEKIGEQIDEEEEGDPEPDDDDDDDTELFAEFDPSKHPRGDSENAGHFGHGGAGKSASAPLRKSASARPYITHALSQGKPMTIAAIAKVTAARPGDLADEMAEMLKEGKIGYKMIRGNVHYFPTAQAEEKPPPKEEARKNTERIDEAFGKLLEGKKGDDKSIPIHELRKASGDIPKKEFDEHLLQMWRDKKVELFHYSGYRNERNKETALTEDQIAEGVPGFNPYSSDPLMLSYIEPKKKAESFAEFDPAKHPHNPAGEHGGQFAKKTGGRAFPILGRTDYTGGLFDAESDLADAIKRDPWRFINKEFPTPQETRQSEKDFKTIREAVRSLTPEAAQRVFDKAGKSHFGPKWKNPNDHPKVSGTKPEVKLHAVKGNSFAHKDAIKAAGGVWDSEARQWVVDEAGAEKLAGKAGLRTQSLSNVSADVRRAFTKEKAPVEDFAEWDQSKHPRGEHGQFAAQLHAIGHGELGHVRGHLVRRVDANTFRAETDTGHVHGSADDVLEHIDRKWQQQKPETGRVAEQFAEHDDDGQRYALMADILGGLFGDEALSLFDAPEKFWEEAQHPRGAKGKFIEKHSAEARSAARDAIARILKGERTADTHKALVEHLSLLTVAQLHELKKEYGLSASAGLKEQLVSKLADRLGRGRHEQPEKAKESLPDSELFKRSGEGFENLQRSLGIKKPKMGPEGAAAVRKALAKHPGGKVIEELLKVDGSQTSYDRNGFADRGGDVYTDAVSGKFTSKELAATAAWLQDEFNNSKELANVNQHRWIRGSVMAARPTDLAPKPAPIPEKLPAKSDSPIASDVTSLVQSGSGETPKGEPTMTTATGPVQWKKTSSGYISADGRFEIRRYMRRNGIEWDLVDQLVPVEPGVSGARRNLKDIKDAAEWRVANRKKATE